MTPEAIEARIAELRSAFTSVFVTGTNGKTTTTSMIDAIVAASGEASARVTTIGTFVRGELVKEGVEIEAFVDLLERAQKEGVRTLAIETTSRALSRGFSHRWPPRVAVFTNLTHDHLDEHGTPANYLAAKAQAFVVLPPGGTAVLNAADSSSALLAEVVPAHARRLAYAAREVDEECRSWELALAATRVDIGWDGTRVSLAPSPLADRLGGALTLAVVGAVHAENALGAALAADALGYSPDAIRIGLAGFTGAPGRFQIIDAGPSRARVVVDYAHTPDALERTLDLARGLVAPAAGRVLVVFGCGGDRDKEKRPEMGRIAAERADVVYLTTDNPRSEDPAAIADAVVSGAHARPDKFHRIDDRRRAIESAIEEARPGDTVVVAGKGHERTQTIGAEVLPFADVEVVRAVMRMGS